MASEYVKTFTDSNFKTEVLEASTPVLVDFWAAWCGPCKMLAPIIDSLADEYEGRVSIGKLNVDENRAIASEYAVMSIPTILIFKDGQIMQKAVGYKTKTDLKNLLAKLL